MPVEEISDIDLGTDEKTFDDLDKQATKATKALEKRNKELAKTEKSLTSATKTREEAGGAFPQARVPAGLGGPTDISQLSKEDQRIEKQMKKLIEKMRKEEVKEFGEKGFFEKIVGKDVAKNVLSFGKGPIGFLTGAAKLIPFLGGVFAAKEIAEFIIGEIEKIDSFFKKFIDIVDERMDQFRSLQEQSDVQAGLTQRILTTSSGSTEPRYSYNTFEEFNNNQSELENKFEMSNKSGVE